MSYCKPWRTGVTGFLLILVLFSGPLVGVILSGGAPGSYLEFPPTTLQVAQPEFSWVTFAGILFFIIVTTWPFWRRLTRERWKPAIVEHAPSFPWWGWVALVGVAGFWILAWTRFDWFAPLQRLTFFPLWFCFIIVLNAVAFRKSGRSLMTHRPLYFGLLFPVSAIFWWIFEYLNRYVNNWYYTGVGEIGPWQYFGESTLAFSTVLPAVMSVRYLLLLMPVFSRAYTGFPTISWLLPVRFWSAMGLVGLLGLIGIGWIPELSYPLVWIAPGLLWVTYERWTGHINPMLEAAARGNLTLIWSSAIAALVCGVFWEMWNIYSKAQWIYNIPGVERFYLFEMPILGYAGYLPFGVTCALVSSRILISLTDMPGWRAANSAQH